jgi:hypothetical protein
MRGFLMLVMRRAWVNLAAAGACITAAVPAAAAAAWPGQVLRWRPCTAPAARPACRVGAWRLC